MRASDQQIGRTWADIFNNGIILFSAVLFLSIAGWFGWFGFVKSIPLWIFASIGMSVIFIPFLIQRAKDDSHLVIVVNEALKLTEYRIGKRYNWKIQGEPLNYTSESGTRRLLITDFNTDTGEAKGSALADFTQFDLARDLGVFTRLSKAFSEHLREERVTKESVAVEVEKRVSEIASRYLGIIYGTLEPTEIESALNIKTEAKTSPVEMDFDEVVG